MYTHLIRGSLIAAVALLLTGLQPVKAAAATLVVTEPPALTGTDCTDAGATTSTDCYDDLQTAINAASAGDTVLIGSDLEIGALVNVNKTITIDGQEHMLTPTFSKTSNSNNATFGIHADDVIIRDLTIDGSQGTQLHGIHAYVVENLLLENLTILDNDHSGVVVNGSTVTVHNITTGGHGWHGINVDQGGGVTAPAILTVTGESHHTDDWHIYLDNTTKDVEVIDVNNQYTYEDGVHPARPNDRLYTLRVLESIDQCKNGGWESWLSYLFKNQGDCVSHLKSNEHAGKRS